jgi:hypothetical protein
MSRLTASLERFPVREFEIRRICARDAEFRSICEDHEAAVAALRHWARVGGHEVREAEYSRLADEIADEILARLDSDRASRATDPDAAQGLAT